MITLTTPIQIPASLGAVNSVPMDKVVITMLTYDVKGNSVQATIQLSSSTHPEQVALTGQLFIPAGATTVELSIPDIAFRRKITLDVNGANAVKGFITAEQNNLEGGLVSVGLITGVQSAGV